MNSNNDRSGRLSSRGGRYQGEPGGGYQRSRGGGSSHGGGPRRGGRSNRRENFRRSGTDADLIRELQSIDGRTYGAYKTVIGDWDYGDFQLAIDRIQADPYAPPSSLRARASTKTMGIPTECLTTVEQRIATADYLVRSFSDTLTRQGNKGDVRVAKVGQEILQRSACTVTKEHVELRFQVQMPAGGRTIQGNRAARLFDVDVPDAIMDTFDFISEEAKDHRERLIEQVHTYEDYCAVRTALDENEWIAFVNDGAILARRSGISQLPMDEAVPFESPDTLRCTVELPHAGTISGMAIKPGVTVIVGGGYHGKSTLLSALQRGVYGHIPGDGREYVATAPDAVKVRAADGRAVSGVDVSPFITHLPGGADTSRFSTENASGSTSQAAAIVEAIEAGSRVLLLDEDTSATNLLIRDTRMRELVRAEKEPITPLVDRIGSLAHDAGVSTIMVMGGSGDYLDVADTVLMLDTYRCFDVTQRAHEVVSSLPRTMTNLKWNVTGEQRVPLRARGGAARPKTKANGVDSVILDKQTIDISDVEQVVDPGQAEAIAWAIRGLTEQFADARTSIPHLLDHLERTWNSEGLDAAEKFGAREKPAFLVRPRRVDVAAALNRYRALTATHARASQQPVDASVDDAPGAEVEAGPNT